jgi:serine/threonine protein kinase
MDGSHLGELSSPSASTPAGASTFAPPSSFNSGASSVVRWQPASRVGSGPHVQAPSSSWSASASASYSGSAAAVAVQAPGDSAVAMEAEESLLGVVLGDRYRIDERIGAGGMGLVYRATHVLIGRKLAVKLLRRRYAAQPDVAERFVQEARVASSVKHPNVVDIIDYGTTPLGSPYYVMEYLAGHSLAREIIEHGPLEPRRALSIAIQIARGLAAAHQAGIIHRDLKPDNVSVVPADVGAPEQVKILDFGIARVAGRKTRLTAAGAVVGTPEYMSPEQARGDDLDVRSDIYALGIVLFELLTGRVPLSGDSMVGTLTKQVFELPPPIREIDPRYAGYPSIEAALARLLAKNRDERPASALDAASLLATAAANDLEPVDERREQAVLAGWSQPIPAAPPEPDRPRRSTIMIGSGAITSAHKIVEAEGPRTGSFAAKQVEEAQPPKRPSVIVTDAPAGQGPFRPARVLHVTQLSPPPAPPPMPAHSAVSRTPTPPHGSPRAREDVPLGKRPRGGLRSRHLPLILVGLGAAIFAALVTIGFVRWWQRRAERRPDPTGMKGSPLDDRHETRGGPNTHPPGPVQATAREIAQPMRMALADEDPGPQIPTTRKSRDRENAVR